MLIHIIIRMNWNIQTRELSAQRANAARRALVKSGLDENKVPDGFRIFFYSAFG